MFILNDYDIKYKSCSEAPLRMKCNLNTLNAYPNCINNKQFKWNSKGLITQNSFAKYKLWFKYFGIVKEKSLSAVVMQNIEKVFILFLRTMHTDFRSSHLEPSFLKKLQWISCIP